MCVFKFYLFTNDGFVDQELDLNNPKTFRNLAKPMGAQTDDRLAQYKKRYKDWEDPNGETYIWGFFCIQYVCFWGCSLSNLSWTESQFHQFQKNWFAFFESF